MGKKVSDQTNGLALFWTYFYIRICLEPNDLAMSYIETANSSAKCLPKSAHYLYSDIYQPGQIICFYTNSNAEIGPKQC